MNGNNLWLLLIAIIFLTGCSTAPVKIDTQYQTSQRFHPDQIWSEMK